MSHAQMMQEREVVFNHWDSKTKRSSGFFSVLKWFRNNESTPPPPDLVNSASSSCDSIESVFSTDTVASFAYVPPSNYRPFGTASTPEKCFLSGPETHTYKARIAQRDIRRENEKDLTLRRKYNLHKEEPDRGYSLPLMSKSEAKMHRRTASESSKHRKAGAYLHVKGKRKAPQPPTKEGTLRRKKRIAPQPPANPDVICNDSLKLDRGILKPAKQQLENKVILVQEVSQVTPKPWYKRTISNKSVVTDKKEEKRKSGNLSFLTNISELDREAMEILERETLKMKYLKSSQQAPAFMRPRNEHVRTNSDSWISPKRRSARDLIAKFNAITGVSKSKDKAQTPPIQEVPKEFVIPIVKEQPSTSTPTTPQVTETKRNLDEPKRSLPNSPVLRKSATKQISRNPWNCPRCTLENDYWRIICRVCSAIKPYFDDFTTEKEKNTNGMKFNDLQRTVFQSNYPRISLMETKRETPPKEETTVKVSEVKNMFQPRYPRLNINLEKYPKDKEIEKREKYEVQKSASQPRISIFDYEKMVDRPKEKIPRSNILEEILKEMKKKEEQNKIEESKLEKIAFGEEIGFKKPEIKSSDKSKVEKIILGDELSVQKPYINLEKTEEKSKVPIVEKMILGDEINIKNDSTAKIVGVKLKSDQEECKNSAKKEEREKLKKMLIEMKNSLPKRQSKQKEEQNRVSIVAEEETEPPIPEPEPEKTTEIIIATTETVYENIKVKKSELPKPIKVSSSSQTNAVLRRNPTPAESNAIKSHYQLIGAKDFAGITNEKTLDEPHTYANLNSQACRPVVSKVFAGRSNTDTLEINRLLKRLEGAIAGGELGQAAVFARELAQLKVPCSVVRQNSNENDEKKDEKEVIDVDMYVEDKVSHRGPFPLQVSTTTTVAELRQLVQNQYKIPVGVQRWILGKRLATDDNATLADHQVVASGCPVFLYLVAPANDTKLETTPDIPVNNDQQQMKIATVTQPPIILQHNPPKNTLPIETKNNPPVITSQPITTKNSPIITSPPITPQGITPTITSPPITAQGNTPTITSPPITAQGNTPTITSIPTAIKHTPLIISPPITHHRLTITSPVDQNPPIITSPPTEIKEAVFRIPIRLEPGVSIANHDEIPDDVWRCPACTLLNPLVTNECEVCGQHRVEIVEIVEEEEQGAAAVVNTNDTYLKLVDLDNEDLVRNTETFECLVCLAECQKGDGVLLRECLHQFCRPCLANTIEFCEEAEVKCPYRDAQYACDIALQDREVKALVSPAVYERHLARSVKQAETRIDNAFHCKSPDCKGWCIFEDNVNDFRCPVCRKVNCLTCQAIHTGMNCKQYQERMQLNSETDEDARRTRDMLEEMVRKGEALACPCCQVVLMKKWGCDWLRCSMCKTEICWVTRGPRWGPGGKGDTSGGCKCGVNGAKCHPKCNYCH